MFCVVVVAAVVVFFCGFPKKTRGCQVMQLDNRGSHFYLALFWAEAWPGLFCFTGVLSWPGMVVSTGDYGEEKMGTSLVVITFITVGIPGIVCI